MFGYEQHFNNWRHAPSGYDIIMARWVTVLLKGGFEAAKPLLMHHTCSSPGHTCLRHRCVTCHFTAQGFLRCCFPPVLFFASAAPLSYMFAHICGALPCLYQV